MTPNLCEWGIARVVAGEGMVRLQPWVRCRPAEGEEVGTRSTERVEVPQREMVGWWLLLSRRQE
jgi:hypothetical protein